MGRIVLKNGTVVVGDQAYIIDGIAGEGANCIVYSAHYLDNAGYSHAVLLKECYPYTSNIIRTGDTLSWADNAEQRRDFAAFEDTYKKLMQAQNSEKNRNSTVVAFQIFNANGTVYSVVHKDVGITYDKETGKSLLDNLETVLALTKAVKNYHDNGYLHLDIKPGNFLVIPETRQLVKLFDLDTVMPKNEIATAHCIPYSENWAAPEQLQGQRDKICEATDLYAIGAILFEKVIGRKVEQQDCGLFADWAFDEACFDGVNPRVKRLLRNVFKKTLAISVRKRYQNADALVADLVELIKTIREEQYILSDYPVSSIQFVGRSNDLTIIHNKFNSGARAVFVHGFGGIGKTELSKKYAEIYAGEYDAIVFRQYSNGLEMVVNNIRVAGEEAEIIVSGASKFERIRKHASKQKLLLIVDNFDVEEDPFLSELLTLDAHILITTRCDYSEYFTSEQIYVHELETLSTKELLDVFVNSYGRDLSNEERNVASKIIESFDNLTILVPMVAKYLLASDTPIEIFAKTLEEDGLCSFDGDSEEIRININGVLHKKTQMNLVRYMFNLSKLGAAQQEALRNLHLLQKYHSCLTKDAYKKYSKSKNLNALNDLVFRGWVGMISQNGEKVIYVHQVIHDLIKADLTPTCDNVPGIYQYICEQTDQLASYETVAEAKEITFALIIYIDFHETDDNAGEVWGKVSRFFHSHFYSERDELCSLFFSSPEESTWFIYSDWFADQIKEWLFDQTKKSDYPIYYKYTGLVIAFAIWKYLYNLKQMNNSPILVFSATTDTQEEQINDLHRDLANLIGYAYNSKIIVLPERVTQDCSSAQLRMSRTTATPFLEQARAIQAILSRINNDEYDISFAQAADDYACFDLFDNLHVPSVDEMYALLERHIIQIEECQSRFAYWGMTETELLEYQIPTDEEFVANYTDPKRTRSAKKLDTWYNSVCKEIAKKKDPYVIYQELMSYSHPATTMSDSKYAKLSDAGFPSLVLFDQRLSVQQKTELLAKYIPQQVCMLRRKLFAKWRNIPTVAKKLSGLMALYYQAVSLGAALAEESPNLLSCKNKLNLIAALQILKKAIGTTEFDIPQMLMDVVCKENWYYFDSILQLSSYIHWRYAKPIKTKVLDMAAEMVQAGTSDVVSQFLDYQLRDLAKNYNRNDVLNVFDMALDTPDKKHHVALLETDYIGSYSKCRIARRFLDGYIEAVALAVRDAVISDSEVVFPCKYEDALAQWFDIVMAQLSDDDRCYLEILGIDCQEEDLYHHLSPFWIDQFFISNNLQVNEGLCYLYFSHMQKFTQLDISWERHCDVLLSLIDYHPSHGRDLLDIAITNIARICPEAEPHLREYDYDEYIATYYDTAT